MEFDANDDDEPICGPVVGRLIREIVIDPDPVVMAPKSGFSSWWSRDIRSDIVHKMIDILGGRPRRLELDPAVLDERERGTGVDKTPIIDIIE